MLVLYGGIVAVFAAFQEWLIFPGRTTQGRPEAIVRPAPGMELVTIPVSGGDTIAALFGPALDRDGRPRPDAATRPTILYFYGNGMCLADSWDEFVRFRLLGANVLIPDYLGYGMSNGRPSEAGCYATAEASYAYLKTRRDVDPSRIVAAGWSLGAAVAADLAARESVGGLVLLSAFTSLPDMARLHYPWLPAGPLLRHRFETERKLPKVRCPVLIGHGRADRIIPFAMSDRLAAAAGGPVRRLTVEAADHNDFFFVAGADLDAAVGALLESVGAGR